MRRISSVIGYAALPHMFINRFLPTQEWSTGNGSVWVDFGIIVRRQIHKLSPTPSPKSPTNHNPQVDHSCVGRNLFFYRAATPRLLGGGCRQFTPPLRHMFINRFLPSQEWSVGRTEVWGERNVFGKIRYCPPPNIYQLKPIAVIHSCR